MKNKIEFTIKNLSIIDRFRIPNYFKKKDVSTGLLNFDPKLCTGCSICIAICPAGGLSMNKEKKLPYMEMLNTDVTSCMACGDCMAACPKEAITITKGYNTKKYFQKLSQTPVFTYPKKY